MHDWDEACASWQISERYAHPRGQALYILASGKQPSWHTLALCTTCGDMRQFWPGTHACTGKPQLGRFNIGLWISVACRLLCEAAPP